jgi:L-lactate dehydrogenase complex protein LldG
LTNRGEHARSALPDLTAALALAQTKRAPACPSMICLITGPRRAGDVERILVPGAHGPKMLTALRG